MELRISDQLIPSQFEIILTSAEYPDETTYPPNLNFVPFPIDSSPTTVLMEDYELERIMLEAGVPFIRFEEMEYSKEQIKYLIIRPVLEEYYKWFPIYRSEVYQIGRSFSIPFPKEATGVKRVIGANSLSNIWAEYQNPFMYAHELNQGAMFGGMPSSAFASHKLQEDRIGISFRGGSSSPKKAMAFFFFTLVDLPPPFLTPSVPSPDKISPNPRSSSPSPLVR